MGPCEHGVTCPLISFCNQVALHFAKSGHDHLIEGVSEHERVGEVVNVLAGAAQVHILPVPADVLLHEVLH